MENKLMAIEAMGKLKDLYKKKPECFKIYEENAVVSACYYQKENCDLEIFDQRQMKIFDDQLIIKVPSEQIATIIETKTIEKVIWESISYEQMNSFAQYMAENREALSVEELNAYLGKWSVKLWQVAGEIKAVVAYQQNNQQITVDFMSSNLSLENLLAAL